MQLNFPIWNEFVRALEWILTTINNGVGTNPGLAIIIFTIIVKFATVPLTMKSIKSGRRMQEVAPLLKEVQKKYKEDKTKLQTETMRIYSEHGVNPMGSCLPMVIQIPIFLALYQALSTLVIGTGGNPPDPGFALPFLWVPNLAHADPFFIWPVLSALFQFISQRMSLPYGYGKVADPQQAMMNKIMQFMPIYLLVVYLNFATGAVIYWTISSVFTAAQTFFVNGFGALAEIPGLTWLPKRELKKITPEIEAEIAELNATGKPTRRTTTVQPRYASQALSNGTNGAAEAVAPAPEPKGFFNKMMAQAIAAQEAQAKAKAPAASNGVTETIETDAPEEDLVETSETRPLNGQASRDGNGATETRIIAPTAESINRKRRSKR